MPTRQPARTAARREHGWAADRAAGRRAVVAMALAAASAAMTVAIHTGQFPWLLHDFLRSWTMHCFALVAAALFTTTVLGYHWARSPRRRRTLRRIGCGAPLAITLLHELGQWIWPAGERDSFDSIRDALLNVLGVAIAWWVLAGCPLRPGAPAVPGEGSA